MSKGFYIALFIILLVVVYSCLQPTCSYPTDSITKANLKTMKGFMPSFLANKPEFLEEIFPAKQREQVSEYKEVSEIFGKYYRQHLLEWNMVKYRFDSSNRMLDARGNPMKVFINNAKETYGFKFTARNYENPKKEFFSEFQIEKSLVQ